MLSKDQLILMFRLLDSKVYGTLMERLSDEIDDMNRLLEVAKAESFGYSVLTRKKSEIYQLKNKLERLFKRYPDQDLRTAERYIKIQEREENDVDAEA